MADEPRQVMVNATAVETNAEGAAIIEAYIQEIEQVLADKDRELAERDARIAELEKQIGGEASMEEKVQARANLIANASKLVKGTDLSNLSDADIRKTAVCAIRGNAAVEGKSSA